mgnify:CR=1 FL=1
MLVSYWKSWYKLTSVQLMLIAAGLGGLAAIFPAFVEYLPWWLNLILGAGLPMAAVVARLWAQPKVTGNAEDK